MVSFNYFNLTHTFINYVKRAITFIYLLIVIVTNFIECQISISYFDTNSHLRSHYLVKVIGLHLIWMSYFYLYSKDFLLISIGRLYKLSYFRRFSLLLFLNIYI